MDAQKVAIIDLGTNTFNLLLAKITPSTFHIYRNEKIPVKIGKDGINKAIIAEEAQARALDALYTYKNVVDREEITKVYAYATSAFRNAKNGESFKNIIEQKTGFHVDIISGEVEAEYIYQGVKTALDIGKNTALIMDIGGGSVEFVICNQDKIFWKHSYEIGAQRLLDWFHHIDPIPNEEIENLNAFFVEKLSLLKEQLEIFKPNCLIGSSGTFDTLSDIYLHRIKNFLKGGETEFPLTVDGFNHIYQQIITLNKEDRLEIPGMISMRVDMIVVAACLVKYVIDTFTIDQIRVSSHSLKEGIALAIQQELKQEIKSNYAGN